MTLKSLEEFDRDNAAQRARLEKEHAMVRQLPTHGKIIDWTGEGGWEKDGNTRKPPVQRSIDVVPCIVHSPFRGAEHMAYKAPDSLAKGEHISSEYRAEFVRRYFMAVLEAYRPFRVDTLAIKGRYASMVRDGWDWENNEDHKDDTVLARGEFVVDVSVAVGEHSYSTAELEFYAVVPELGPLMVSFALTDYGYGYHRSAFDCRKLYPWPQYEKSRGHHRDDARIRSWTSAEVSAIRGAQHKFQRSGDGSGQTAKNWHVEWLFADEETLLAALAKEESTARRPFEGGAQ